MLRKEANPPTPSPTSLNEHQTGVGKGAGTTKRTQAAKRHESHKRVPRLENCSGVGSRYTKVSGLREHEKLDGTPGPAPAAHFSSIFPQNERKIDS